MTHQAELLRLVENVRTWVKDNLESSQPKQAHTVRLLLIDLHNIATNHPEQAQAALIGAKTMWHMLRDDAWIGFGVRHARDPLPVAASRDDVEREWKKLRESDPKITKTKAANIISKSLGCSVRTVWERYKDAGI